MHDILGQVRGLRCFWYFDLRLIGIEKLSDFQFQAHDSVLLEVLKITDGVRRG
jgi:hypothetical protein